MQTRLSPRHVPAPARGLAASHRELRQALAALRVCAHGSACPPEGHALWSMVADAVSNLHGALARHLRHEGTLQGLEPGQQAHLETQHTQMVVLAVALAGQVARVQPGQDAAWQDLRADALRTIEAVERHLEYEARLLLTPRSLPVVTLVPIAL